MNESMVIQIYKKLINPLKQKVLMLATRVVVELVDDDKKVQLLQVEGFADEILSDVENFQSHGFTSNPGKDAEALMISVGGNREHNIVVSTVNREKRLNGLKEFESALYFDKENFIAMREGGKIEMKNKSFELIQLQVDLIQAIIDARTFTLSGPQPLINLKDPFPQLLTKFKTFLKG